MASNDDLHTKIIPVVLRTLIYYDIFNYPLTFEEISCACNIKSKEENPCKIAIDHLLNKKIVFKIDEYYSLNPDKKNVQRRKKGNQLAEKWIKKAKWFSKLISIFPFVRGISLSGSLSKGFIGDNPDIDYFIITKPNRLWLTRTMLVLFKKIFLFNSYKYFCVNYFIDTENLEIEEKNLFTATEINTLIPVYGRDVKRKFYEQNGWVTKYYPNFKAEDRVLELNGQTSAVKNAFEALFNNRLGDWLDDYTMNVTVKHWAKKFYKKYSAEEFNLVFKSQKSISKHHPRNYQNYVLKQYCNRVEKISEKHDIEMEGLFF
ncbi:MAG: hypothetical protein R2750_04985 [Bacteroidales bacterium]